MKTTTLDTLSNTLEHLAALKAQIATLKEREVELKETLIASGLSAIDSVNYRATICEVSGKDATDWRSVAMKFNPSRQLLSAHTTKGDDYFQVRVFARKTS